MNKVTKILVIALGAAVAIEAIVHGLYQLHSGEPIINDFKFNSSSKVGGMSTLSTDARIIPAMSALNYEEKTKEPTPTPYLDALNAMDQVRDIREAQKAFESGEGTIMYVYGRYSMGEGAGSSYSRVPEGTILLSSKASTDGGDPSKNRSQDLFLAFSPLSEDAIEANGLIPLEGTQKVVGFVMAELTANGQIQYVSSGPNGTGTPISAIIPNTSGSDGNDFAVFTATRTQTGELYAASADALVADVLAGYSTYNGFASRETAMANGYGCGKSAVGGGSNRDAIGHWYKLLEAAINQNMSGPSR